MASAARTGSATCAQPDRIEAARRDDKVAQFNERSRNLVGDVAPDPDDVVANRVRLDRELASWGERNSELAGELAAEEAAHSTGIFGQPTRARCDAMRGADA